jgi:DNA-binding PadR family transcriptional regulator
MPRRKLDPLPSVAFQILLALADNPLHGYAIMRQVNYQTEGRMRLGPATLYGSIQTLLEAGLIEDVGVPDGDDSGSERRRYYGITVAGRKIAREEAEGLARVLRVARAKKILRGEYV